MIQEVRTGALGRLLHAGGIWREQECLKVDFGVTAVNFSSNSSKKSLVKSARLVCFGVREFFCTLTFTPGWGHPWCNTGLEEDKI